MPNDRIPTFSDIRIGEPDANAEFFSALRTQNVPIFLDCFFTVPQFPIEDFITGAKYIVYGQKGTGKTSILRYIKQRADSASSISEFLIFKKAFLEEIDLTQIGTLPIMVDEEQIKRFKHFHHTIKRLIILIILSKILKSPTENEIEIQDAGLRGLIKSISNSSVGDVIRLGIDSISTLLSGMKINAEKITDGAALVDAGKIIKRNNDDLLNFCINRIKRQNRSVRVFLDEIHFAYRTEESLQQDAILVRDTILAVQNLNERFADEGVNAIIYMSIRAEYLEHPIISTADINHSIESVGFELTWSNFPQTKSHPLFELIFLRFKRRLSSDFKKDDFFRIYLASIDPRLFLERTWTKPRDFIRFFKCAQKLYPNRASLSVSESNAVWRNYAQEAWKEIKSSASPFLPPQAISLFEETMAKIAPSVFDGSAKYDTNTFGELFRPVFEISKGNQTNFYDFNHFLRLLYILGIFLTRRRDAFDQDIYHSYHRGNRNFHAGGEVLIHPTVLKAFG